jgi:hypothetical protein
MARLAYRRPVTAADTNTLLAFFDQGAASSASAEASARFDEGIQFALERLLVDPDFLLRVNRSIGRLSDVEVASRLSFFLWSSIPDDRLLTLAEQGQLAKPAVLEQQVRRMLADRRAADALVGSFAAQWLNLRRVGEVVVDPERYPNYDLSLMAAFERETEMFVASTIGEDRGVATLLDADYTFANEWLARHYGIPGVWQPVPPRRAAGSQQARRPARAGALLRRPRIRIDLTRAARKILLNNIFGLPVPPRHRASTRTLKQTRRGPRTMRSGWPRTVRSSLVRRAIG